MGDSIGVLVFTPVLLLLFGARDLVSARRKYIVCLTLVTVFVLAVVMFFAARDQDHKQRQIEFDSFVQGVTTNLHAQLSQYLVILRDTTAMFESSEHISHDEFSRCASGISAQYPGLVGLSWSEVVPAAQRAAYEARMRAAGFPDFSIREFDVNGGLVPAGVSTPGARPEARARLQAVRGARDRGLSVDRPGTGPLADGGLLPWPGLSCRR